MCYYWKCFWNFLCLKSHFGYEIAWGYWLSRKTIIKRLANLMEIFVLNLILSLFWGKNYLRGSFRIFKVFLLLSSLWKVKSMKCKIEYLVLIKDWIWYLSDCARSQWKILNVNSTTLYLITQVKIFIHQYQCQSFVSHR